MAKCTPQIDCKWLLAECEAVCRVVAPQDLAGVPMYLVSRCDLDDLCKDAAPLRASGWTSATFDLQLQPSLVARGEWHGRGFAAVVDMNQVTDIANDRPTAELLAASVALHELAHWLTWPSPRPDVDAQEFISAFADAVSAKRSLKVKPAPVHVGPPWAGHGLKFIRAGCHLLVRSVAAGYRLSIEAAGIAGRHYGLSHADKYWAALGGEPERLAGEPIRSILDQPYPVPFVELFEADVARFICNSTPAGSH